MAFHRPIGAWMLAAFFFVAPVACLFEAEVPDGPCTDNEAVCDDNNPCTKDICGLKGFCSYEASSAVPDDKNPCTDDVCVDLEAQHSNVPDGEKCGLNGMLQCIGGQCACDTKAECGVDTPCLEFTCINHSCGTDAIAKDTFIDNAEEDDCKKNVCDGNGNIEKVADTGDVPPDLTPGDCKSYACSAAGEITEVDAPDDAPADDDNPCTTEGCDGGNPINSVPVAGGTACGAAATCGPVASGFEEISQPACFGGACMPASASSCGFYACNGDACREDCQSNAECASFAFCNSSNKCVAQGDFGQLCGGDGECSSTFCVDGVCCGAQCDETCRRCDIPGLLGVCNNIPIGQDPDNECAGTAVCDGASACGKPQGDSCGGDNDCINGQCEDGVCCNIDCTGPCKRCDIAGNVGVCGDVASGQTPAGCDTNGQQCNGAGACKKAIGAPCGSASECLSGFCPSEAAGQRVCCDKACTGTCESCVGSKTVGGDGTCAFITNKTDPDNECAGTCMTMGAGSGCCNGSGVCTP